MVKIFLGILIGAIGVWWWITPPLYQSAQEIIVEDIGNCTYMVSTIGIVRHLNCTLDTPDPENPDVPTQLLKYI